MAQWWERSPPSDVARVEIPASTPCAGWLCCWFSPLFREVFSPGTSVFPSSQKPTFPNSNSTRNQVDEESLCGCATSKSLFIYNLFVIPKCRYSYPEKKNQIKVMSIPITCIEKLHQLTIRLSKYRAMKNGRKNTFPDIRFKLTRLNCFWLFCRVCQFGFENRPSTGKS